jgi:thiamine biosynthesis protein ThiS
VTATIAVTVNGDVEAVEPGRSVADLLDLIGAGPRGIAVARNEDVVPRSAWAVTVLHDGDRIEILDAAQGG